MYIFHNKTTNELIPFSNLPAISQNSTLNLDTLKYHFYRKKSKEWETDNFRIVRTDLIKSKRK